MSPPRIRCAIYTRKSTEEGLDQDFNSLDAQHEACAAYIASQKHEGWKMLPARYDDGGISGGTLDRPALQRLTADIDAGRVDMVVVYKIDRLTRSLADFAKLVERLEAANCSFVSVTQAFNTSSSMGRLTLNVLLSFAQFEREVTAERIRDKIAASKKKGLWMGGVPPLGYDPHPDPSRRELVVNESEARVVQQIFHLYLSHGCLNGATRAIACAGLRSKAHAFRSGRTQGGRTFSRGQIHHLLTNPIYIGLIRHKDITYPGLHAAIVEQEIWDRVQFRLQANSAKRRGAPSGTREDGPAPLKGKIRDAAGDLLTPSHTLRKGKRIRYYVSNRLISDGPDPTGWRIPAVTFERSVTKIVADHLADHARRHAVLSCANASTSTRASDAIQTLAAQILEEDTTAASALITGGQITAGRITITLDASAIAKAADLHKTDLNPNLLTLTAPFTTRRRGAETKIIAADQTQQPDATLIRALRQAHLWADKLKSGIPMQKIARHAGVTDRYIARLVPLTGLSPKIQRLILNGAHPADLTLEKLVRHPLPLGWADQEGVFGITP
jgi:DNA invertase Pin-like site-specific DNA recombinase